MLGPITGVTARPPRDRLAVLTEKAGALANDAGSATMSELVGRIDVRSTDLDATARKWRRAEIKTAKVLWRARRRRPCLGRQRHARPTDRPRPFGRRQLRARARPFPRRAALRRRRLPWGGRRRQARAVGRAISWRSLASRPVLGSGDPVPAGLAILTPDAPASAWPVLASGAPVTVPASPRRRCPCTRPTFLRRRRSCTRPASPRRWHGAACLWQLGTGLAALRRLCTGAAGCPRCTCAADARGGAALGRPAIGGLAQPPAHPPHGQPMPPPHGRPMASTPRLRPPRPSSSFLPASSGIRDDGNALAHQPVTAARASFSHLLLAPAPALALPTTTPTAGGSCSCGRSSLLFLCSDIPVPAPGHPLLFLWWPSSTRRSRSSALGDSVPKTVRPPTRRA